MSIINYQLISDFQLNENLIEKTLLNRGIPKERIEHFLNLNEKDILDPLQIDNMREGAKMLTKHAAAHTPTYMTVDSDFDGYTSAALFLNYLHHLFPSYVENDIIYGFHDGKEHGIELDMIPPWCGFVIMIDSSSNDYEEHRFLKEHGIDVLVIDHHEAEKVSENACIINNQLCEYPNKTLCGGGMAYKFCSYIDSLLGLNYSYDLRDLAAVALIGDMMDLRNEETHYLVNDGLSHISNPFLSEMIEKQSYSIGEKLTPIGIAFYVVPFVNAITRSGTMEEKRLIFDSMLEYKAYASIESTKRGFRGQQESLVEQAVRTCVNVKSRQKKAEDAGKVIIEKLISDNNLLDNKILLIQIEQNLVNKNLAGLIANQLASKYQRPTLVLRRTSTEDGETAWEGSARGYSASSLADFRQFMISTDCIMYAEGHGNAFGCGILDKNIDKFIKISNELLKDFDFSPSYRVDFIFDTISLNENYIYEIAEHSDLWGQEISEPLVVIKNVKVNSNNIKFMGANGRTMRIGLKDDTISCIAFNLTDEDKELLNPEMGYIMMDIIGTFELNTFNGNTTPQIKIKDYEVKRKIPFEF